MNFARVCIEINASFSFTSTVNVVCFNKETLENITVPVDVEYQSKPPSCPTCKTFGHSPLKCPKANYQWVPKAQLNVASSKPLDATPSFCPDSLLDGSPAPNIPAPNDNNNAWVSVSIGAKIGKDPIVPSSPMGTTNTFSPIATPGDPLLTPGTTTPTAGNPLVSKLKVFDEKEGKDLKQKQRTGTDNPQAAKKRNKGKGKVGNPSL